MLYVKLKKNFTTKQATCLIDKKSQIFYQLNNKAVTDK